MIKKYFFKDQKDCETFFRRLAENCKEEFTPDLIFEGNSDKRYQYIMDIAEIIGYKNIGIRARDYEDADVDFVDTLYLRLNRKNPNADTDNRVWIEADEISLETDGTLRIWWD